MSAPNFTLFDHLVRAGEQHRRHVEAYAEEDDAPTISPLVLSTMANNSLCSASGTLNFAIVSSKSLQKAIHSLSVILRCFVLGATCGPTDHLGHVVFEARRADAVMRLFNCSVRVQDWIVHTRSMKSSTKAAIE